ncbi:hypothetical protein KKE74_01680 [Patescibacteria group bacterium]|nr:hypothetical protein [Patescibacteria group bacterium]
MMGDNMRKSKFKILTYQNYLSVIKNSQNSKIFRNFYVLNNNKKRDILKNGQFSCARYVSSILKLFDLISETHATVDGTIKDMLKNKWKITKKLVPGNVLVWGKWVTFSGEIHSHFGFYLGKNKAISHRDEKRIPIIHHYTYNQKRKIIKILTHKIIKENE